VVVGAGVVVLALAMVVVHRRGSVALRAPVARVLARVRGAVGVAAPVPERPSAGSEPVTAETAGEDDDTGERPATDLWLASPAATQPSQAESAVPAEHAGATPADEQALADVPPEFLSNEQRVLALLSERDGRMPQADIVDGTDWSKSTVSRVLSEMADEDRVVKIDVGARNVIALPDAVPPGVESPLDR
jgi:hypothetical protein